MKIILTGTLIFLFGSIKIHAQNVFEFDKIVSQRILIGKSIDSVNCELTINKDAAANLWIPYNEEYRLNSDCFGIRNTSNEFWFINIDSARNICSIIISVDKDSSFTNAAIACLGDHDLSSSFNNDVALRRWTMDKLCFWLSTFYDKQYFIICNCSSKCFMKFPISDAK